jgi:alpha-L-fucosidase
MRSLSLAVLALLLLPVPSRAESRAAWMRQARWGVMTHFLADWIWSDEAEQKNLTPEERQKLETVEGWNALVDGFDVEALARQLEEVGAGYYLLSIGQNSGYYLAPNATYDHIVGRSPSRCSRRDLVSDMAAALAPRGIRLMVYLPSGAPAGDREARSALEWTNGPHPNTAFKKKWEDVVRDWSQRWGRKVAGWWFDGCYWPNQMYRGEAPNFATLAAAARAGNPDSAVAFNPGQYYPVYSMTEQQDYVAGEVKEMTLDLVKEARLSLADGAYDGAFDGVQLHVLGYMGDTWGRGKPRFDAATVAEHTLKVLPYGGALTWDVPVQRNGTLGREYMERLRHLHTTLNTLGRAFAGAAPRPASTPR